jgi:hypothetical protein
VPTGANIGGSGRSTGRAALEHRQRIGEIAVLGRSGASPRYDARPVSSRIPCTQPGSRRRAPWRSGRDTSRIAQNGKAARGTTPASNTARANGSSRRWHAASVSAVTRLPPADSPATATRVGSPPSRGSSASIHCHARHASSIAAG